MDTFYPNIHEREIIALGAKEGQLAKTFAFGSFVLHKGLHLVCGFPSRKEKLQLTN